MPEAIGKLACGQCGKNYAWKPEYAGRTLKCKCGATIKAPAAPAGAKAATAKLAPSARPVAAKPVPVAAVAGPADIDDIEKMLSQAAEYDVKDEPAPPRAAARVTTAPVVMPAGGGGAGAAAAGPTSPLLGYARTVRQPVDEGTAKSKITDLYAPLALLIVGIIAYFYDARLWGIHDIPMALGFILVKSIINLFLVFTALLIGVKLIDLGLGPIGSALLKIAAVALLPGALGDIITIYTMGMIAWGVTILMYWGLLAFLFDMDLGEVVLVTGILWTVQTWISTLLVIFVLSALGVSRPMLPTSARGPAVGSLFGPGPNRSAQPEFDPTPEGQDKRAEYWIENKNAVEAREWLKPEHADHAGVRFTTDTMLQWTEKFYAAGAKKVWAADFHPLGSRQSAEYLLVEMPADQAARAAILKLVAEMDKHPNDPEPDDGAKYLYVGMGRNIDF